jgi:hypothetical protein
MLLCRCYCHFLRDKCEKISEISEIKCIFDFLAVAFSLCSAANSVLIIPPIEFCKMQSIFENHKEMKEKYKTVLAVFEYALPFTEFCRGMMKEIVALRDALGVFLNSLGESSRVILRNLILFFRFFHLYHTENGIGD